MRSSATVGLRAFLMLACAAGIPVLAMWGSSWSDIVKKFQNLRWPSVVEPASASMPSPSPSSETPRLVAPSMPSQPPALAMADAPPLCPPPAAANSTGRAASDFDWIPKRLQELGATYYVLESWGNDQQLYRFYCKMAVAGNDDYTHCFEATDADPCHAMQQVLQQVESWRSTTASGG